MPFQLNFHRFLQPGITSYYIYNKQHGKQHKFRINLKLEGLKSL